MYSNLQKQKLLNYSLNYKIRHASLTIVSGVSLSLETLGNIILYIPNQVLNFLSSESIAKEESKQKVSAILAEFHYSEQRRLERFQGKDPSKVLAGRKGGLKSPSKK